MIRLLRRVRRHPGLTAEVLGYLFWLLVDAVYVVVGGSRVALAVGVVVPLVVLQRRRAGVDLVTAASVALGVSISVTAIVLVLGPPGSTDMSFAEQLAMAVLVVAVLRSAPLRPALVLTAVAAVAVVGSALLRTTDGASPAFAVLSALGWGGAVGIGLLLRDAETRRRASLEEVRSSERMALARDLHDVVAHHVTGIIVAAQAASVVARSSPDDVDRALDAIEHAGTDAMAAMRAMVGVLRGQDAGGARTPGAELGGVPSLVSRFDPGGGVVRFRGDPGIEHAVLPAGVAATGYRVVQEALTNVRRHAPGAAAVEVDVRLREEELLVSVRNDGVPLGGPAPGPRGFGLVGMAERVTALGGDLTAGPTGPGLWSVAARIPLVAGR
ncbi:sensor histidine kinase [Pseudonocardia broussonetiae]|uniref:histidine kinase n=1 Tax=Pseudonocardia broussonetiae TaxID=2736640 RepID=A0A6M6JGC5_9PSEU|nr:histidine kinase [Pseudonocardia broussonetiae]QJY46215.1 two-component sensor histidine kinase [Pseudonocardia broussonetiae]